jgi:polysaccharide deacetylase family protein (PEP-CTERM system associated)
MVETTSSVDGNIKNCISIDIEGFVESNLQSFSIKKKYISKERENYEIEKNVNIILTLLDDLDIQGTFFFLGRVARDLPNVIKKTAQCGHEIACHSHEHVRVYGLPKEEFKEGLTLAKKTLEDASGSSVYGFRAPDFSITKSNLWALDILKEAGFLYDSSIYPIGLHDVYGVTDAKRFIYRLPNGLIEFPLATFEIFGRRFPFGGGGYFRLYPLIVTKLLMRNMNKRGHPCMLYIHPYEVGTEIPYISEISHYRRFRHYYNCRNGDQRLKKILRSSRFSTAIEILKERKPF